ncbi:hypothetical protein [Leptolyngbya sp. PCC 6406]|uniref:hypothetical protein n=1 Tax=Leptolyngbya sp. PCC 6406 TaxID=1173264 RepID=UPI0002AC97D7|nr:hypothetical protein [Leptolyngbya sp. PCC 6406]
MVSGLSHDPRATQYLTQYPEMGDTAAQLELEKERRQNRWLIYALGGGWGHLNRAIALTQAVPHFVDILVNSPYTATVQASLQRSDITLHGLPEGLSVNGVPPYIHHWITQHPADCLIVDTFPRGLVGELADLLPALEMPRILVHRDLDPRYLAAKQIPGFVQQHYDRILVPGEESAPLRHLPQARLTAPWLLRESHELSAMRETVRDRYRLQGDQPLILICATGRPDELSLFGELVRAIAETHPYCTVRCLAHRCPPTCPPNLWITHWPGIEVLQLADIVIGGGGYNLTYECAALGKPLIALPLPRRYDRQFDRSCRHSFTASNPAHCLGMIAQILARLPWVQPEPAVPNVNGVHQAVREIQALAKP